MGTYAGLDAPVFAAADVPEPAWMGAGGPALIAIGAFFRRIRAMQQRAL